MNEEKTRDLEQQVLGLFSKSYSKRYEQWKRQDLLSVAIETMPKQVDADKVIDNLIKLKCEFAKRLSYEGWPAPLGNSWLWLEKGTQQDKLTSRDTRFLLRMSENLLTLPLLGIVVVVSRSAKTPGIITTAATAKAITTAIATIAVLLCKAVSFFLCSTFHLES